MLKLENFTVEHQNNPIGLDCQFPRFGWVLVSDMSDTMQLAYQLTITSEMGNVVSTGKVFSENSIEVVVNELEVQPKTIYKVKVTVWDNHGNVAFTAGSFESGLMKEKWESSWLEPEQEPTEPSIDFENESLSSEITSVSNPDRDYHEFRPVQYIRIPINVEKKLKKARIYMTAHGVYQLEINGSRYDDREFAPGNSSYDSILEYQTYDVTNLINSGNNIAGITLGDGWWCGRVGGSGDSCQYGNTIGILFQAELKYEDGSETVINGENGVSSTGPIIFSDIFVGEKYDANKENAGWSTVTFDDSSWKKLKAVDYPTDNLCGQYGESVRPIRIVKPIKIIHTPKGEMVLDVGQVLAGQLEIRLKTTAGQTIRLEHSETLDKEGNYFNNILGTNKEQTDFYITKDGQQTYRPSFSYHGFRYVKITGWPGEPTLDNFRVFVLSSEMKDISQFVTSDARINRLHKNIWWSQVSNTLSIPTDCPQRERAGWTGDIMAFSPTMAILRQCDSFLTRWLKSVRGDQQDNGAIPMIVPFLKAYENLGHVMGGDTGITSCGWGDAVVVVPLAMYRAYGDKHILEENYHSMQHWISYIEDRAKNNHPEGYDNWDKDRQERSKYLWNTDFHYGDWLVPSMVLGNPDGGAMIETAYKTKEVVAPAYFAFTARSMVEVAEALGKKDDAVYYRDLYGKIRQAFIDEYVHEDGTIKTDLQGLYVIALKNDLVADEIRPAMIQHLQDLIKANRGCLDTGFLSVLFLMDVLCANDSRDIAYSLLFQNQCPSWLYEVEHGATTMWESWGAVREDGEVSTYSYNHYAFGCIGEWLYRELGGIQAKKPGYKEILIKPALDCGLSHVQASQYTVYGKIVVDWEIKESKATVKVTIPANTTAEICLPGLNDKVGSGAYKYEVTI